MCVASASSVVHRDIRRLVLEAVGKTCGRARPRLNIQDKVIPTKWNWTPHPSLMDNFDDGGNLQYKVDRFSTELCWRLGRHLGKLKDEMRQEEWRDWLLHDPNQVNQLFNNKLQEIGTCALPTNTLTTYKCLPTHFCFTNVMQISLVTNTNLEPSRKFWEI